MTRSLQNLANDIRNGMLYLPLSDLKAHNLSPEDLSIHNAPERTRKACTRYAQRAAENFTKAYAYLSSDDLEEQMPNLVYGKLHQALLHKLEKNQFKVLDKNISLSPIKKLSLSMFANAKKIVRQ